MDTHTDVAAANLLIADEDTYVVHSLARLLRPFFGRIFTVTDGDVALEILALRRVDIIIADALIPPITGIELFRMAKFLSPNLTTVMMSWTADMPGLFEAKRERVINAFVAKPWVDADIVATIHEVFAVPARA